MYKREVPTESIDVRHCDAKKKRLHGAPYVDSEDMFQPLCRQAAAVELATGQGLPRHVNDADVT